MVTRMRDKGQVTIPVSIRQTLHLDKDSILSVARVGNAVVLAPHSMMFDSVSAKFCREAKKQKLSVENLLEDLKKIRHAKS